jgi:hypothetical protein
MRAPTACTVKLVVFPRLSARQSVATGRDRDSRGRKFDTALTKLIAPAGVSV